MGDLIRASFIGSCWVCHKPEWRDREGVKIVYVRGVEVNWSDSPIWVHEPCLAEATALTMDHLVFLAPRIAFALDRPEVETSIGKLKLRLRDGEADLQSLRCLVRRIFQGILKRKTLAMSDGRGSRVAFEVLNALEFLARDLLFMTLPVPERKVRVG